MRNLTVQESAGFWTHSSNSASAKILEEDFEGDSCQNSHCHQVSPSLHCSRVHSPSSHLCGCVHIRNLLYILEKYTEVEQNTNAKSPPAAG